ncbi:hypothetical protein D7M11_22030 [Paenibacillus ginsengarvi]|uniref:Uncharacterized protein n=1 Tax=Paenibacillus ginsengarvi TaxID=400777 RepID=A0A3B0C192_9BACL|nr:hypothetical protein D7M11_22030 [Paenibacillus ginsengarvi]
MRLLLVAAYVDKAVIPIVFKPLRAAFFLNIIRIEKVRGSPQSIWNKLRSLLFTLWGIFNRPGPGGEQEPA